MEIPHSGWIPIVLSVILGLQMVWAEFLRGRNTAKQAKTDGQNALTSKQIDNEIEWRNDILEADKTLRADLAAAYKLIADINTSQAMQINTLVDKFRVYTEKFDLHDSNVKTIGDNVKEIKELLVSAKNNP